MRFLKWYMVCPPASSEAGARPLEGQQSIQINECLGAISVFIYGEIMENARGNHGEIMGNPWGMWYYCAVTGESKKIVFTSGATEKITSGGATSDFWSPHK
jgi:hypothetical protein